MRFSVFVVTNLAASLISLFSLPAVASEMSFTPRASISFASYDFSQSERPNALAPTTINNNDFPEVKFDVTFKILGVGGTFFKDGYYLDLLFQKSLDEEDSFTLEDPLLPGGSFSETFEGDREDSSITFGKKVLDNRAGIYLGYKAGKSQASGNQGQDLSFKEKGFFIGSNYSWPVRDKGVLSINVAFADLDGDLKEDVSNPAFASPAVLAAPLDIDATSNAKGLSYGISWSARINESLSYSIGIDSKSYTFEDVKDKNPDTITSDEFKEDFLSTTFSLYFIL